MSIGQSIFKCAVISSFALIPPIMLSAMEKESPQPALQMSHITPAFAPHFTDAQVKGGGQKAPLSLVACRIAKMAEEEERVPRSLFFPLRRIRKITIPSPSSLDRASPLSVKCCNSR